MNVVLTPSEMLHVLQTVLRNPMTECSEHENLVAKLKKPILDSLEKEEERQKGVAFNVWTLQEERKIDNLKQKNAEIRPAIKAARRK